MHIIEGPKASPGKWLVHHGIHRGTITSRDSDSNEYGSLEEARAKFAEAKAGYAHMGYVTWFAYLYDDQGKKTVLDNPQPYR